MTTILLPITILCVFILSSIITLWGDVGYYKMYYEILKNNPTPQSETKYFHQEFKQWYFDQGIIWFEKTGGYRLGHDSYLHSSMPTYFHPYALYYLIKFNKLTREIKKEFEVI